MNLGVLPAHNHGECKGVRWKGKGEFGFADQPWGHKISAKQIVY